MRVKDPQRYVADFETTSKAQYIKEGRTRVYLWCFAHIHAPLSSYYYGVDIESFIEKVFKVMHDGDIMYFHNFANFDSEFILWYLLENNFKIEDGYKPKHAKSFTTITTDEGRHYCISIKLYGKVITFYDSYLLIPVSIKELATVVGLKKLDETHDYNEIKNYNSLEELTQEELMYIREDVHVMQLGLQHFLAHGLNKMTISSSAYANWRNTGKSYLFEKTYLRKPIDEEVNNLIDLSYRGAITYVNPRATGVIYSNVVSYDFNSMYPSKMLIYSMPCGVPMRFDTLEEAHKYGRLVLVSIHVTHAKVIDSFFPFMPTKKNGIATNSYEYADTVDNKFYTLWEDEYLLFKNFYKGEWEELNYVGFKEMYNVFTEYINYWREIKENPKTPAEKFVAKRMLNSLYGKFGMNEDQRQKQIKGINGDKIEYEVVPAKLQYKYRAIASRITSLARIELITAIENNRDRFLYCDTDSIYLKGKKPPDLPIDDRKFNHWAYEGHYDKIKFLKTKCYMKRISNDPVNKPSDVGKTVVMCAGLPPEAKKAITFENFTDGLKIEGKKKCRARVKGGVIIDTTDFTINANLTTTPDLDDSEFYN